jgi:hypothetical protein
MINEIRIDIDDRDRSFASVSKVARGGGFSVDR